MKIAVVNAWGTNRGDEAMISALLSFVNVRYPGVGVDVHAHAWLDLARHRDVDVRPWVAPRDVFPGKGRIARRLQTIAALLSPSADRVAASGFSQYDLILSSPAGPYLGDLYPNTEIQCLFQLAVAAGAGVPFGVLATSSGPFRKPVRNALRRPALSRVAFWSVRERLSANYVQELGIPVQPVVGADLVFSHPSRAVSEFATDIRSEMLSHFILSMKERPTILVTLNVTDYLGADGRTRAFDLSGYVEEMAKLLSHVLSRTDCAILLVPHFYLHFQEQILFRRLQRRLGEPERVAVLDPTLDAECQMELYSYATFAISHRYHPTIFAARVACPFLCIRHQFKVDGMLAMFGDPGPKVSSLDGPSRWIEAFDEAWRDRDALGGQIREKLPSVVAAARRHLVLLSNHLDPIALQHGQGPFDRLSEAPIGPA